MVDVIKAYHGDWAKFGDSPEYKKWENEGVGQTYNAQWLIGAVTLYLQQTNPKFLAPIFNASSISVTNLIPDIYELSTRNVLPSDPPAERLLARFPDEIISVFPSPSGQVLAFAVGEPVRPALYVIAQATNGSPVRVDEGTDRSRLVDGRPGPRIRQDHGPIRLARKRYAVGDHHQPPRLRDQWTSACQVRGSQGPRRNTPGSNSFSSLSTRGLSPRRSDSFRSTPHPFAGCDGGHAATLVVVCHSTRQYTNFGIRGSSCGYRAPSGPRRLFLR